MQYNFYLLYLHKKPLFFIKNALNYANLQYYAMYYAKYYAVLCIMQIDYFLQINIPLQFKPQKLKSTTVNIAVVLFQN